MSLQLFDDAFKASWIAEAFHALSRWARHERNDYTAEQARAKLQDKVSIPADLRWWGTVIRAALKHGLIERTNKTRPARSSHYASKPVYRSVRRAEP